MYSHLKFKVARLFVHSLAIKYYIYLSKKSNKRFIKLTRVRMIDRGIFFFNFHIPLQSNFQIFPLFLLGPRKRAKRQICQPRCQKSSSSRAAPCYSPAGGGVSENNSLLVGGCQSQEKIGVPIYKLHILLLLFCEK